ncbi:MAG: putative rane protein [Actinomycetota bacterium]|nr:putative rane protein [Actinomycetota bacterium]
MRKFSVRPAITLRSRKFKGLRGFAGKPFLPPLTDIPIGAYVLGAGLDVGSVIGGHDHTWAREMWHAGTFVFVGGAIVSVFAALTGFFDWLRSSEPGTQARRTANTHATIMLTVTALAIVDIALRLNSYHTEASTPVGIMILSLVIAALVSLGATYGGSLVFDYGFNVETAGDSPVWHKSETDVLPGEHGENAS